MADNLVKKIKCGDSATGFAEVTSHPSRTYSWTDSVGNGRAVKNAVNDLDDYDAACKKAVVDKVNDWMDSVKCVKSSHCNKCKKHKPYPVRLEDVEVEDKVHKETGNPVKKGTISMERTYKVRSGPVHCVCPGQVVIARSVAYRPVTGGKLG